MVDMRTNREEVRELHQLAKLNGVLLAYDGAGRSFNYASEESLRAALGALGEDIGTSGPSLSEALQRRRRKLATRGIEPVIVAWEERLPEILLTVPERAVHGTCRASLITESGETGTLDIRLPELPVIHRTDIDGETYLTLCYFVPHVLPFGYHRFVLELEQRTLKTVIISAPLKTYTQPESVRDWGVFLPLYALETEHGFGCGDYSDLRSLGGVVAGWGGSVVGTLPLLPVFLDEPFDPSPYSPVTRLAWNEFYLDPRKAPEFVANPEIREIFESRTTQSLLAKLHTNRLVDYRGIMDVKKNLILKMVQVLSNDPARSAAFEDFVRNNPDIERYARFRAVLESRRQVWQLWPERLRNGDIHSGDYDETALRYYLYSQWLARDQIDELAASAKLNGVTLYFDLPLGVHRNGYDVWRYQELFALGASSGAPPDAIFTSGQDWGFPPLHPERIREDGYRYVRDYLRHNMADAGMLRIDHVMGLHRLFWIPRELEASQGVYVRYRPEELYAVLCIESNRAQCEIIGEDLGNVPGYVRTSMSRHGLRRMFIITYELADSSGKSLGKIPADMVAALNTHDMAPFATFWSGRDIDIRSSLGLLDVGEVLEEKQTHDRVKRLLIEFLRRRGLLTGTSPDTRQVLEACLKYLASDNDKTLLVNLEDLWLETEYQNIPGTTTEHANWRHKARYRLDEVRLLDEVVRIVREIDRLRKNSGAVQ